jgi:hypothetical protein
MTHLHTPTHVATLLCGKVTKLEKKLCLRQLVFGAQVGQNLPLIVKKLFSIFSAIQ